MDSTIRSPMGVRGFTLIELIMVMVLLGVMAAFLTPQLNTKDFDARGFHDETLALLRCAQKAAIAQRRTVCVSFTSGSAALSVATAPASSNCDGNLTGPKGETPAQVTAPADVAYQAVPAGAFWFSALGQPSQALALQVTQGGVAAGPVITVEADTGYVHD
jgi:MSHA pilin protein MshC